MEIEGTLRHVVFLARHLQSCDLECATTAVLLELGVSAKYAGFDYTVKAVLMYLEDPTRMLTKDVYPTIGKMYKPPAKAYQVERSIRTVINDAWENRDDRIWSCYFPPDRNGEIKRPTNAEFISMIGRFVKMWRGCCKGVSCDGE